MSNSIEYQKKPGSGKVLAGLILLAVGAMLLLNQLDFFMVPHWIFTWPMWLIVFGLYQGGKSNFRNPGSIIVIVVGCFFLLDEIFPRIDTDNLFWPVIIIAAGLWMILGRNKHPNEWSNWKQRRNQDRYKYYSPDAGLAADYTVDADTEKKNDTYHSDDYLDSVSVFSGVKKTILSKDFKGGEIVNIFGGSEIDLTQADINGRVIIDATQVFGGIKLFVPAHWQVVSDVAAVFAGFDDKRRFATAAQQNPDKILVIKGISIFAGIDIRSF
jgi:predicted membrane protein